MHWLSRLAGGANVSTSDVRVRRSEPVKKNHSKDGFPVEKGTSMKYDEMGFIPKHVILLELNMPIEKYKVGSKSR